MTKIAIMNCRKSTEGCTAASCLTALREHTGSFEQYAQEGATLLALTDCGGCEGFDQPENTVLAKRLASFGKLGAQKVHLGICVFKEGKCPHLKELLGALEQAGLPYELGTHPHS